MQCNWCDRPLAGSHQGPRYCSARCGDECRASARVASAKYNATHRPKIAASRATRQKSRRKTDLGFRLASNLRTRVRRSLRDGWKAGSAVRDLGCTIPELRTHLEAKFQPGMTWENWSRTGWHIDHIRPLASFDLTDREQFLEACHYTNLQPLWAMDNLKKRELDALQRPQDAPEGSDGASEGSSS